MYLADTIIPMAKKKLLTVKVNLYLYLQIESKGVLFSKIIISLYIT